MFFQSYEDPTNLANDDSLILPWWSWLAGEHGRLVMLEGDDTTRRHTKFHHFPVWQSMWYKTVTTMTSDPYNKPEHDSRSYLDSTYDSLKTYVTAQSGDLEQCFLHADSNYATPINPNPEIYPVNTWMFRGGWATANDVNSDNIRDDKGYGGFAIRKGLNYVVFTDLGVANNALVGMGVYTQEGRTFLDTVTSNTNLVDGKDSLTWNVGDTTNLIKNAGFELPSDSGWFCYASCYKNYNIGGSLKIFGDSSRLIVNDYPSGQEMIRQPRAANDAYLCPNGWPLRLKFYFRSNSTKAKVFLARGDEPGYGMVVYEVPAESADMAVHRAIVTQTADRDSFIFFAGFPVAVDADSTDTLIIDSIQVFSTKGYLLAQTYSWLDEPDSAQYGTVIDSFSAVNHCAIASEESLARVLFASSDPPVWMTNSNYSVFQNFWKQHLPKWINRRSAADGETLNYLLFDEVLGYVGQTGIPRKQLGSTGDSQYLGVNEYQGFEGDTLYRKHLWRFLKKIEDTLALTHPTVKLVYNGSPDTMFLDSSEFDGVYLEGGLAYGDALYPIGDTASGLWTGCMVSDHHCGYVSTSYRYNVKGAYNLSQWRAFGGRNKLILWDSQYNTWDSASADSFRAFETAMAKFLVMTGNDSLSYFFPKESFQYKPASVYHKMLYDAEIGLVLDTIKVLQSGLDSQGRPYLVLFRKFLAPNQDTVYAVFVPRSNSSVSIGDQTKIELTLPETFLRLNFDGSATSVGSSIAIRQGEGAILMRMNCQ